MEPDAKRTKLDSNDAFSTMPTTVVDPIKHATDYRVPGQPFVRLSKAEKRVLKYERAKAARQAQNKVFLPLHSLARSTQGLVLTTYELELGFVALFENHLYSLAHSLHE